MPDIDETLRQIDRGETAPGTMREGRKEFQSPVIRPDDRPQAGATFLERAKASFFPRKERSDQRKDAR